MIFIYFRAVLVGVAIFSLLVLVGIVIYQKAMIKKLFSQRSQRIFRVGMKWNGRVDTEKYPQNSIIANDIQQNINKQNLDPNVSKGIHIRRNNNENNITANGHDNLSRPIRPFLRHDSVLISEFEVDYIRQIQNFLLFPILTPLSEQSLPAPNILQVWQM